MGLPVQYIHGMASCSEWAGVPLSVGIEVSAANGRCNSCSKWRHCVGPVHKVRIGAMSAALP